MFAYCGNNPVNGCDPCGTCFHRWDFWNDCEKCGGENFDEKLENFADNIAKAAGDLWNGTKKVGKALYDNTEVFGGVGMGFEAGFDILDFLGVQFGMHGNFAAAKHEDKTWSVGNEYWSGFELSMPFFNFGYNESGFGENFEGIPVEESKWAYPNESWTIVDVSAYLGVGFSFRIGFDLNQFLYDIDG